MPYRKKGVALTPRIYNWLLAAATLLMMLGVAEAMLRWLSSDTFHIWPPGLESRFEPVTEIMPGVEGTSAFTINDMGVRGRNRVAEDRLSILALGGSTTECLYLDDRETWPWLLQDLLNAGAGPLKTWIGNAGRSGHSTRNHVLQARKMLEQYPDVEVLILMIGVNDLVLRLQKDTEFLPLEQESQRYRRKLFYRSFAVIPPMVKELPFLRRLALWQNVRMVKKRIMQQHDLANVETATGRTYIERRHERASAGVIRETLPDLTMGLNEYEQNVRAIIDHAGGLDVRVVLLTQPSMWDLELPSELSKFLWLGGVGDPPGAYYSVGALAQGMAIYNRRLLELCTQTSATCIDVAAELARDTTVFYDDVHFNEGGARQVADLVAKGLVRAGIVTDERFKVQGI